MDTSIKNINKINELDNLIKRTDNKKEIKEKENELNNFATLLYDNLFPAIQKIEFYNNETIDILSENCCSN